MIETSGQDGSPMAASARLRVVTAASLFDGADAAIHIMRRLIQTHATEVIHLGHNRSVDEVVRAALQEDADAIVVSSHQGGHIEYFTYMIDLLHAQGVHHLPVFVSSQTRFPDADIAALEACGVAAVYHPSAGAPLALTQVVADLVARASQARADALRPQVASTAESASPAAPSIQAAAPPASEPAPRTDAPSTYPAWWPGAHSRQTEPAPSSPLQRNEKDAPLPPAPVAVLASKAPELVLGRMLSQLENESPAASGFHDLRKRPAWSPGRVPVVGITGTGGAGKSSVTDELLLRFLASFPAMRIAVLSVDPTRRRSGGALLGDRIRMNALRSPRVYMRSMATRRQNMATSAVLHNCIQSLKSQDFDLVIVETAGIGQSDSTIVDLVDLPIYVMTRDYGAASQLEKIDMLDFAELIILNKYDQAGAADALRDIRQQWRRNRQAYDLSEDSIPVYPTIASQCNDPGMTWVFVNLCRRLHERLPHIQSTSAQDAPHPPRCDFNPQLEISEKTPAPSALIPPRRIGYLADIAEQGRAINARIQSQVQALTRAQQYWQTLAALDDMARPAALSPYPPEALTDANSETTLITLRRRYHEAITSVSADALQLLREWPHPQAQINAPACPAQDDLHPPGQQAMPTIIIPHYTHWGDLLRFLAQENLPGQYPYTSGTRADPTPSTPPLDLIADAGSPERANHQFHAANRNDAEIRLISMFDSVTLYGEDPEERLDIQGKIGYGGVSVPTLDAMKKLYSGFDLCAPNISVTISVNGPAPILVAMLINTAIDQQVEKYLKQDPQRWQQAVQAMETFFKWRPRPDYDAELPPGHDTLGLGLLGISGDQLVDADTYTRIKAHTLSNLRGQVRVDVLEQDQADNTCIFSPEFSLRMLGDMQQYCAEHAIQKFHTIAVSGTRFAALGATPITQLAFALSNGLTLVECYLARGLSIDQIASTLHFFLALGDELESSVLGRVARRIWARVMRERYGAAPDNQPLQYERSSHADKIDIQTILRRELGVELCENPWQGSFIIDALTDLVEEAVYLEFEALSARGGVLGAMGGLYQRDKIQEEWRQRARVSAGDDNPLPPAATDAVAGQRAPLSVAEKTRQIANVQLWNGLRNTLRPGPLTHGHLADPAPMDEPQSADSHGLPHLQHTVRGHGNVFSALMETVKTHSLGQITHALYAAGGEYRRTI